jgi:predicted SAM-dependent methyltransferase
MKNDRIIQLNLGCGDQRLDGFIGIDRLPRQGTDLICDLGQGFPVASSSVDHIYTKSVLEHIGDLESVLKEILRVLKPGSKVYIYVPHWSNPFYYSDYTHRRFFGLTTFDYFARPENQVYRAVPTYNDICFQTEQVRLLFQSPFRWLNWPMKGFQWLINRRISWQLFYEYHLSTFVPCYAIEYTLRRK